MKLLKPERGTGFYKAEDPAEIEAVMREYMMGKQVLAAPFIAAIRCKPGTVWNGRECKGGLIIEGSRPFAASTSDKGTLFSITNGDSDYTLLTGSVWLHDIKYLELLRHSAYG